MQKIQYDNIGVMISCTGSAVMSISRTKDFIDDIAKMGYNFLEIGMESIYEMEGEPYFGYLRGRYTKAEIEEIESYANSKNVKIIPQIQTLGHMDCILRRPVYSDLADTEDIILIDDPRTYEFIEKMFKTLRSYFKTDLINIGMDEAPMLGLGRYLDKNGYTDRHELFVRHLNKVVELAKKYGFKPHMWSDTFFRVEYNGDYYPENPKISQKIIDDVPKDVGLCYWDYGEHPLKESIFKKMFDAHLDFNNEIWFAGGAWCWNGFAPFNKFSVKSMKIAMKQAIAHNIKNIMVTAWSNEGGECSYFSVLPSLYAIRQFADGNFDMKSIKEGFEKLFGVKFDDFMKLDLPNKTSRNKNLEVCENASKSLFYNDCFLGFEDHPLSKVEYIPFNQYARVLRSTAKRAGKYAYLFENLSLLCRALDIKAELGLRTRKYYREKDKEQLKILVKDYSKCIKRIDEFEQSFRNIWLRENKPFGWEKHLVRFGGLKERLADCRDRLKDFIEDKVSNIPELDEDILPYVEEWGLNFNSWNYLYTIDG